MLENPAQSPKYPCRLSLALYQKPECGPGHSLDSSLATPGPAFRGLLWERALPASRSFAPLRNLGESTRGPSGKRGHCQTPKPTLKTPDKSDWSCRGIGLNVLGVFKLIGPFCGAFVASQKFGFCLEISMQGSLVFDESISWRWILQKTCAPSSLRCSSAPSQLPQTLTAPQDVPCCF